MTKCFICGKEHTCDGLLCSNTCRDIAIRAILTTLRARGLDVDDALFLGKLKEAE